MKERHLGRSGLLVSRLGLGTMTWGHDTDPDEAAAQLVAFVEAGGTLVDTADVYNDGDSERILGHLLRDTVDRDGLVIATKAAIRPNGRYDGSRRHLLRALDASLDRLGLDHVDLWQLHVYDPATPLEETLSALDEAVASGRARYVGVSNYAGWQIAKAAAWQRAWPGRAPIVSAQLEYSLLRRDIEREVVPAVLDAGAGLLPWSPLGRGVLTGKYRTGIPAGSRRAALRRVRPALPRRGVRPHRGVGGHRRRGPRPLPPRRGAGVGPRPGGGRRADRRRPHRGAARRHTGQRGPDPAERDPRRAGR